MLSANDEIVEKLIEAGLDEKQCLLIIDLASQPPAKASEIGKRLGLSRMDAYNSLKKLQEEGLVKATLDKPIRFFGMPINEVFKQIIRKKEFDLQRVQDNLKSLNERNDLPILSVNISQNEDSFSVIKDRHSILATAESVISESEERVWLLLGKWGILHLLRTGTFDVIKDALERNVDIKLLVSVDEKTIRYYDNLDKRIEIRHLENFNLSGIFVDNQVGIQYVNIDESPTGRGKEETAILMESNTLVSAQNELLRIQWNGSISYQSAKARILDGMITEPLQLTIGEGSFYDKFKSILKNELEIPVNAVLTKSGDLVNTGDIRQTNALAALGINTNMLFDNLGQRVGAELAVKLSNITDEEIFWKHIAKEWQDMGMGNIEYDNLPPNVITVREGTSCDGKPMKSGIFCNLDESLLAGVIKERYGKSIENCERHCTTTNEDACFYEIKLE